MVDVYTRRLRFRSMRASHPTNFQLIPLGSLAAHCMKGSHVAWSHLCDTHTHTHTHMYTDVRHTETYRTSTCACLVACRTNLGYA